MRIVVTGGAGFIGSHLCRELLGRGHQVVVLDDLSTGFEENLAELDVDLVRGSILELADLDRALEGADAVTHLAAVGSVPRSVADPERSHAVNATGTVAVLEAARRHGVGHVTVASSSSVYGANPALPKHEDLVPMPVSPYAVSKLATESYALAWAACYGLDVMAFRLFNVFGPHQRAGHDYAAVIPAFLSAALEGRPLPVHGDGTQSRDFTFVATVAGALADVAEQGRSSARPVNLAFGSRVTLLELITTMEEVLGTSLERQHLPRRAGDVDHSLADGTRLHELLPDLAPVDLRAGLADTVAWFTAHETRG